MCLWHQNKFFSDSPDFDNNVVQPMINSKSIEFHKCLPDYNPTPLISLPGLSRYLGIRKLYVKDEAHRFGLKAFKSLGASYAIYRFLIREEILGENDLFDINKIPPGKYTFCTATDGNHGRAVAWTAKIMSQNAVIFMPKSTVPARIKNIESENARVIIVDGEYDAAVKASALTAEENGWIVISDTAYENYTSIPSNILAGYQTLFKEIESQLELHDSHDPGIDLVILQGGVGSFAASAAWYFCNRCPQKKPKLIIVEPTEAACLMGSAKSPNGGLTVFEGSFNTIMAGLNCGTPSITAWPILKQTIDIFIAISDEYAREAMRRYYYPLEGDTRIISGESGASGLGGLLAILKSPCLRELKQMLGLDNNLRVLIFNTEGDTDPKNFNKIVQAKT
ncbi:MAG: diaminopropionate ammonia-lyase [candidate division Zixibacteria bacterium]